MRDTPFSWTRIARRVIRVPDGMSAASDMEKLVEPTWSILMPLRNTVKGSICWSNKVAVNSTFLQCICLVWTFIKKAIRMGKINDENSEAAAPTSETMKVAHSWTLKVLHSKHPMEVIFVDESVPDLLSQPLAPLCWLLVMKVNISFQTSWSEAMQKSLMVSHR